jgi:TRAP-type transport system periplasmic protein
VKHVAKLAVCLLVLISASAIASAQTLVRIGSIQSETFYMNPYIEKFQEIVNERTDGAYEFRIFYNSTLGNETEMFEQLQAGTLEMQFGYSAIRGNFVREMEVIGLPGLLTNFDEVHQVLNGPIGEELSQMFLDATGVRILWFVDQAHRNVFLNDVEVNSVEDLQGIRIRSPDSPLYISVLRALGMNPTPMGFNEIYTAVQTGVVAGHEQETPGVISMKFYEIENVGVLTKHLYQSALWEVSEQFFQSLPEEHQQIFEDAAREAGIWFRPQTGDQAEAEARTYLEEEHGFTFVELDQEKLDEIYGPMADEYARERGIYDLVQRVREELGK